MDACSCNSFSLFAVVSLMMDDGRIPEATSVETQPYGLASSSNGFKISD